MRTILLTALLAASFSLPALAQNAPTDATTSPDTPVTGGGSSSSSSSSSEYFRGYGVKGANVFAAKYKERLRNWREQIELGLSRGFLQPSDAEKYKAWLDQLTAQDTELSAKGYPKAETDDMEQKFNAFNVDFTNAMQPKATPAAKPTPAAVTPPSTVPPKAPPAIKPAAKAPVPAAAKRKPAAKSKAKRKHR
jgi:hypothetical protein